MECLKSFLLTLAGHDSALEGVYSARRRHLDALVKARDATALAIVRLQQSDIELLGRIFSSFCIGK